MVTFSNLVFAALVFTGSFASPTAVGKREGLGRADFVLGQNNTLLPRQDYQQDYTTGGDVIFTPSGNYYKVAWSTQNDFVVGLGWTTGAWNSINFSGYLGVGTGTGLLSVYGWSTNPLVEYYIVEDSLNPPSFGTFKGTVYSDGSNYNIYENTRYNAPSIQGTSTFNQYISVRQSPRQSGTVTVSNHFQAWANHALNLGSLSYQVLAVEGWGGEGAAAQSVSRS